MQVTPAVACLLKIADNRPILAATVDKGSSKSKLHHRETVHINNNRGGGGKDFFGSVQMEISKIPVSTVKYQDFTSVWYPNQIKHLPGGGLPRIRSKVLNLVLDDLKHRPRARRSRPRRFKSSRQNSVNNDESRIFEKCVETSSLWKLDRSYSENFLRSYSLKPDGLKGGQLESDKLVQDFESGSEQNSQLKTHNSKPKNDSKTHKPSTKYSQNSRVYNSNFERNGLFDRSDIFSIRSAPYVNSVQDDHGTIFIKTSHSPFKNEIMKTVSYPNQRHLVNKTGKTRKWRQ